MRGRGRERGGRGREGERREKGETESLLLILLGNYL
jgi:hypothetical protein